MQNDRSPRWSEQERAAVAEAGELMHRLATDLPDGSPIGALFQRLAVRFRIGAQAPGSQRLRLIETSEGERPPHGQPLR